MDQLSGNPGLSPEVQQALQRRQGGAPTPQLNQVSVGAAQGGQMPPPMAQSGMTQTSTPPAPSQSGSQKYQPQNQQDMIVAALVEQLKSTNQLEKEKLKMSSGQVQSPQSPASTGGASGGTGATPESYLQAPSIPVSQMQGGSPFGGGF